VVCPTCGKVIAAFDEEELREAIDESSAHELNAGFYKADISVMDLTQCLSLHFYIFVV
jgi:hypothetical protein